MLHCWRLSVCIAVIVNGLNNFQIGFLDALPTAGVAIDVNSYTICASVSVGVTAGLEVNVVCTACYESQYVIVQSIDTSAEELCLAEVCVNECGQYAVTFVVIGCSNYCCSLDSERPDRCCHLANSFG